MITLAHRIIAEAILLVIATFVVALRFIARKKSKLEWKADDWLSLAAWAVLVAYSSGHFWAASNHFTADDPTKLPLPQLIQNLKITYAHIYLMSIVITFSRLSIIFLYYRIFGIYEGFRRALWIMGALTMGWVITIIFLNIFRCRPIAFAYNLLLKGKCLNQTILFVVTESINCALDLALVLLPLRRISFLQLSIRDRIGLYFVFLTGGFVCITSVLRIVFTYNIDNVQSAFWLTLQLAFAVICSCLPTLRTYLPKHIPSSNALKSYLRSLKSGGSTDQISGNRLEIRKNDDDSDKAIFRAPV